MSSHAAAQFLRVHGHTVHRRRGLLLGKVRRVSRAVLAGMVEVAFPAPATAGAPYSESQRAAATALDRQAKGRVDKA
jgi:hypothetical protein